MSTTMPPLATAWKTREQLPGRSGRSKMVMRPCSVLRCTPLTRMSSMPRGGRWRPRDPWHPARRAGSGAGAIAAGSCGTPAPLRGSASRTRRGPRRPCAADGLRVEVGLLDRLAGSRLGTPSASASSSTSTLILMSPVVIIFMLTPSAARAANIRSATPVCVRMPVPTTETLLTLLARRSSVAPSSADERLRASSWSAQFGCRAP